MWTGLGTIWGWPVVDNRRGPNGEIVVTAKVGVLALDFRQPHLIEFATLAVHASAVNLLTAARMANLPHHVL